LNGVSGDLGFGQTNVLVTALYNANPKLIPNNMFASYFTPATNSGHYTIGGWETQYGPLTWIKSMDTVDKDPKWNVQLNGIMGFAAASNQKLHFDSGAGVYQFPSTFGVKKFYDAIGKKCSGGQKGYMTCKCGKISKMNPLVINLNGYDFTIPASAYVTEVNNKVCQTRISFVEKGSGTPRLSANWQQYFYIVFDITNSQMGFNGINGTTVQKSTEKLASLSKRRRK